MRTQQALTCGDDVSRRIGHIAEAIASHDGGSDDGFNAAFGMIQALKPRDTTEAMFAGHCVLFHELLMDQARRAPVGQADDAGQAQIWRRIFALDACFGRNLTRLERYRRDQRAAVADESAAPAVVRPDEVTGTRDRDAAAVPVEPGTKSSVGPSEQMPAPGITVTEAPVSQPPAPPAADAQAPAPRAPAASVAAPAPKHPPRLGRAAKAAAKRALRNARKSGPLAAASLAAAVAGKPDPKALAALEAGDPLAFAQAIGIKQPGEAFLAAAAIPGSPFNRLIRPSREAGK